MPKRSNDFQKLVYLIRTHLCDGARVTESKMLRDRITKTSREVDVVIEGAVGGLPVVVAVECRDHQRISDVTWVEAMKTKHERLPTNALILASSSGFTPEAKRVAAAYNIELVALEEFSEEDVAAVLGMDGSLWARTVSVGAERVIVETLSPDGSHSESVTMFPDNLVYMASGDVVATIQEVVQHLLSLPVVGDFLLRETAEDHKWFDIVAKASVEPASSPYYMRKLESNELRKVESVRVMGPCKLEMARFGLRCGKFGNVRVSWARVSLAGREAFAVVTNESSGHSKLTVAFDVGGVKRGNRTAPSKEP